MSMSFFAINKGLHFQFGVCVCVYVCVCFQILLMCYVASQVKEEKKSQGRKNS